MPPSVLLPALPRNVKWHFCFTAVAATGDLTERLLLALTLSLIPPWGTMSLVRLGMWPSLAAAAGSQWPKPRWGCCFVCCLCRGPGVLGEQRHILGWEWPCETMVVVNTVTILRDVGGQVSCLAAVLWVSPVQVWKSGMPAYLLLFLQLLLWEDEAASGGTVSLPEKKDRSSLLR